MTKNIYWLKKWYRANKTLLVSLVLVSALVGALLEGLIIITLYE